MNYDSIYKRYMDLNMAGSTTIANSRL